MGDVCITVCIFFRCKALKSFYKNKSNRTITLTAKSQPVNTQCLCQHHTPHRKRMLGHYSAFSVTGQQQGNENKICCQVSTGCRE